jgi:cytidine deaminase
MYKKDYDVQELIDKATAMMDMAYTPYSHFNVGAALLCKDGTIFTGCNIENAAYPDTICAERTAIFKAVSEGHRDFKAIAIISSEGEALPCGSCRQVMVEFSDDMDIITVNDGKVHIRSIRKMMPYAFDAEEANL